MPDVKTKKLFQFLTANRIYSQQVQYGYRCATLLPFHNAEDKAYALLHDCYYTQSQAKLNMAKTFFMKLANNRPALSTFRAFAGYLEAEALTYQAVHHKLANKDGKDGWGPKTAALFLKNVYQIHHAEAYLDQRLTFWSDVPKIESDDRLFIPVDAVITKIFEFAQLPGNPFDAINKYIYRQGYRGPDLEIWDDLWFWGFVTQKGSGSDRHLICFNEGKYWSILHAPKDNRSIEAIKNKCKEFVEILNNSKPCQEEKQ